ncbi:hypothetical protein HPP92_013099 [Vanilla planifolia]|uniref:SHSP domain-containing protein n=1 Tax=Vanilla planifolia TaxID=51239 RepID=A0A835UWC1_VANPL|nr:hypothetical protein HPP92_013099 [Vanilla planifolia]
MAALMYARRVEALSKSLGKLVASPPRPLAALATYISRSLSTNAAMCATDDELDFHDDPLSEYRRVPRRRVDGFPSFFAVPRTVSHLLNVMDAMADGRLPASRFAGWSKRGWDAREDKDALHLRFDMPGLGKEHVKLSAEQGTLVVKGEGDSDPGEGDRRRYSTRIDLSPEHFRLDQIRAVMKNGILKVVIPKVAEDENKAFNVEIE